MSPNEASGFASLMRLRLALEKNMNALKAFFGALGEEKYMVSARNDNKK